jgi:tRNA-specific 2-thiouridylase
MPLYVIALRPEDRAVVIGPREALLGRSVHAGEANWLGGAIPSEGRDVLVRIRHRATPVPGTVLHADERGFAVALHEPAYAISPGQSVVLYDADGIVIGGGIIAPSRRVLPIQAA